MFTPLVDHDYSSVFEVDDDGSDFKKIIFKPCETTLFNTVHLDVQESEMTSGSFQIYTTTSGMCKSGSYNDASLYLFECNSEDAEIEI